MFILMVQCILESLLSLSCAMDLLHNIHHIQPMQLILVPMDQLLPHQVLMVIYRGNNLGILLLLLLGMLIPRTNNMDCNLLTHLHHTRSMLHLTNRCHPYSQHLRKRT